MPETPFLKNAEMEWALEVVETVCRILVKLQKEMVCNPITKSDRSPVTLGDFAGQAIVSDSLSRAFPEDALVAEEKADLLRRKDQADLLHQVVAYVVPYVKGASPEKICDLIDRGTHTPGAKGRFWTLDPIDGTKGFIRGDQYVVALALIEDGVVTLSVVGCPKLSANGTKTEKGQGVLTAAIKNGGAWRRSLQSQEAWQPLHVSGGDNFKELQLLRSVEVEHTNVSYTAVFMEKLKIQKSPIFMDSQAKYVMVASGQADAFFYMVPLKNPDYRMKIWDVAPGALLVHEAGGRVTDLKGKALDFTAGKTLKHNPGLLITNGKAHSRLLESLGELKLM